MANCKDCLHVEVCNDYAINYLKPNSGTPIEALEKEVGDYPCCRFQDRSLFVELPCKVGDSYFEIEQYCTERGFYNEPRQTDIMDCEFCDVGGVCDRQYCIIEKRFNSLIQIFEYKEKAADRYNRKFLTKEEAEQALNKTGDKNA